MSNMHPQSEMEQMISACERALEVEDWSELKVTKTLYDFDSTIACNALGALFENAHQVLKNRRALRSLEMPKYLSLLRLHDPEIRLKHLGNDGKPLNLFPIGEIPVSYLDIVPDTTQGNDGLPYTGPHLVAVVDTGMFNTRHVDEGLYTFLTPLKIVEVSNRHIPHEFN